MVNGCMPKISLLGLPIDSVYSWCIQNWCNIWKSHVSTYCIPQLATADFLLAGNWYQFLD
jgi:hypothetical protein